MGGFFPDLTSDVLKKSLDVSGHRQRVIANNIANVETPGFKRSEVSFDEQLKRALAAGNPETARLMVRKIEPDVRVDELSPARPDGNNVSIDREMADLTKNTLEYEALVRLLNIRSSMVRTAITGGQ